MHMPAPVVSPLCPDRAGASAQVAEELNTAALMAAEDAAAAVRSTGLLLDNGGWDSGPEAQPSTAQQQEMTPAEPFSASRWGLVCETTVSVQCSAVECMLSLQFTQIPVIFNARERGYRRTGQVHRSNNSSVCNLSSLPLPGCLPHTRAALSCTTLCVHTPMCKPHAQLHVQAFHCPCTAHCHMGFPLCPAWLCCVEPKLQVGAHWLLFYWYTARLCGT